MLSLLLRVMGLRAIAHVMVMVLLWGAGQSMVSIYSLAALRWTLLMNRLWLMRLLVCTTNWLITHLAVRSLLLLQLLLEQLLRIADYGLVRGWRLTNLSMGYFFDLLVQSFLRLLVQYLLLLSSSYYFLNDFHLCFVHLSMMNNSCNEQINNQLYYFFIQIYNDLYRQLFIYSNLKVVNKSMNSRSSIFRPTNSE